MQQPRRLELLLDCGDGDLEISCLLADEQGGAEESLLLARNPKE
jgi:hypothetical protein